MKLLLFYLVMLVSVGAFAETCGQLAGVKGSHVEILRRQVGREGETVRFALKVGEGKVVPLECDDVVLTGRDCSAKIILAAGKLSLGPESRIEMANQSVVGNAAPARVNLINLTYGKMRALIHKAKESLPEKGEASKPSARDAQVRFRVRTYSAVAGVRGTDFYTSYDPNSGLTEQATIEGFVEVQQSGTSQKVMVESGYQVAVESSAAAKPVGGLEPPKNRVDAAEATKPLLVTPIRESLRNEIRVVSAVVKDDREFAHPKAIETLGKPETWTLEREKIPAKLDKLKNEF